MEILKSWFKSNNAHYVQWLRIIVKECLSQNVFLTWHGWMENQTNDTSYSYNNSKVEVNP